MKIRIVQASMPGYWYRTRIGETFTVVHVASGIGKVEVQISEEKTGYVDVVDCEVVAQPSEQPVISDAEFRR